MNTRLGRRDDLEVLVDLHWRTFPPEEHVPVMLGKEYVRATYKWQICSYDAYVVVAEREGQVAGCVTMADGAFTRPMFFACLPEFVASLRAKPALLLERRLWGRLLRGVKLPPAARRIVNHEAVAQLIMIFVDSQFRGQGVVPAMLEAVIQTSRARGSRAIRVGVYKENVASRKAFLKAGWVEVSALETAETVFFMAFLDGTIRDELGVPR
jgi:ribosomal protein S18 acetylase RimI-like enzyme